MASNLEIQGFGTFAEPPNQFPRILDDTPFFQEAAREIAPGQRFSDLPTGTQSRILQRAQQLKVAFRHRGGAQ